MKKMFTLFFGVLSVLSLFAQHWEEIDPEQEFNYRLAGKTADIQSIECDFVQEKYLDVFAEKVISKGKFYFRKENKICLIYTEPLDYRIIINGQILKIVADGKTNVIDLSSHRMMEGMNRLLTACMIGDLSLLREGYQMKYFRNQESYWIQIKPLNQSVKEYLTEMSVYFDRKDMSVSALRLSENRNDYTDYKFVQRKFNTLTDDEKFAIR